MEHQPKPPITRPYPLPPLAPDHFYVEPQQRPSIAGSLMQVEESDPFDRYAYLLKAVLHSGRTAFQEVLIADTYNYGRALFLDGVIQSSEDDESLYHELLVQPAMLRHPEPRDVLILGGGEGATLREVLAHGAVRSCTMVDIDHELVELSRAHLQVWHRGAFDDPRARIVEMDGRTFVERDATFYDVVIVDLVDMLESGPAQQLYTRQFYELLKRRLRRGAIVAVQGLEFSFLDEKGHAALARTLRTMFSEVYSYRELIPSFLGAWGFIVASDWFRPQDWPAAEIDRAIAARLGARWLDHLDGAFLRSRFELCKETQFMLAQAGPTLEDGVAFVPPPDIEEAEPPTAQFPALEG
jgi:spermidine synthase